ncbi:MAG TPA: pyridoxal 5'-phosphate synthase glutaminase subunit PdxT [Thermoanaerobaculaceae bacterium]|nr:pyridoxal 5'-phosphate synthase glutaminase subunit PdxT [Thermoanaerobaculaceae bacterium]HPS77604.1 pyridoxal 5'-phosphate synthase glutaminase subunit PdxT [Thermoanaerobaculaceae bacterium]
MLALQGDFEAHARALAERGMLPVEVRRRADLHGVSGLVLPGGESTTMLKLMNGSGLAAGLEAVVSAGTPVLATCAGVILIARRVHRPEQPSLGLLDVEVERNAYGRQLDSAVVVLSADADELGRSTLEGVFIRAPRLVSLGKAVRPLAWRDRDPVLVEQGNVLAATFHPELSAASPVVDRFVARVRAQVAG